MGAMLGGEIVVKILKEAGVEKVFGIMDGSYFGLVSKFRDYGIEIVTPRHEASAAHAAGAYARMTGKLGVCLASNGPGVANLLGGLVVENAEGNRVLAITSYRRTGITCPDRGGAFQVFDQEAVIKNIAKWVATVRYFDRIPELTRRALRMSYVGRPGVVCLNVPEDLLNGKAKLKNRLWEPNTYRNQNPSCAAPEVVAQVAEKLVAAKIPMIHAGSGVIHSAAYEELAELAEILHAPVTTSWSGRGVLAETNYLSFPLTNLSNFNQIRNTSDLVLCLGARLGETDWWGKAPYWCLPDKQSLIQVDIDDTILGCNRPADMAINADIKTFLKALIEKLRSLRSKIKLSERKQIVAKFAQGREKDQAGLKERLADRGTPIHSAQVPHICRQVFDDDAIMVLDGGNTAVWGTFFSQIRVPNTQIYTHHFGMLGAGVGHAIGAAVARPDKQVFCLIGDGAFGMHPQEIETAIRHGLKIVYLVCSDKQWGMVKMNQQFMLKPLKTLVKKSLDEDEVINVDLGHCRYDKMAEAMGAHGEYVSSPDELKPALLRCLESGKCSLIHVEVDPVKHMWAPGLMEFKDMHAEPAGK
jgi:acetolactate synthase-1/2/3 large subunit